MRLDLICATETIPVDLVDGRVTVGGSPGDDICIEGLPHGLLTLLVEGLRLTVTSLRSVRVGDTLFPARTPRLVLEGEEVRLQDDVVLKRAAAPGRAGTRAEMATAFVARELLEGGDLPPQQTRAATLTCVTGIDLGAVFVLPFDANVIGRGESATIPLRDRAVSRQHAKLVKRGRAFFLQLVTSSMNGVYLNGLLVKRERALKTGDVIELGQTILRFDEPERAPEERTEVAPLEPVPVPTAAERPAELELAWWETVPASWWFTAGAALLGVTVMSGALLTR